MAGRDCWHAKCTFCSWTTLYPKYRTRRVDDVLDEIQDLVERYGVKEIMDDSGSFPAGSWLTDFCNGMNDHNWVASFDWFFSNGQNWLKVYEGNYDNKRQVSRFEQSLDVAERAKGLKNLVYGTGNNGTTNGFADTPDEQ